MVNETESIRLANGLRSSIAYGHPTGQSFDIIRDGWEANAHIVENKGEVLDDDIATNNVNDEHGGNANGAISICGT